MADLPPTSGGRLARLFDLTGRVAIVTGGSRGLGLQIAEALGEYGAVPVLVARRQAELDAAVASLGERGIVAHALAADLRDGEAVRSLAADTLARFGRIDILVNNAGAAWGAAAEHHPIEGWSKVIDLNLTGLFLLTQAVARAAFLPQGGGAIINIASILGLIATPPGQPGTAAYSAAKGAVLALTRQLAAEWGDRGVRVNAIAPGYFPSKMTAGLLADRGDAMVAGIPLRKLGGDIDLMGAALLLASDAGGHITGQTIVVDGGTTIV